MSMYITGVLILCCCLPSFGFALRGIVLLRMRKCAPGRIISASGVIAMLSMWLFAGLAPRIAYEFVKIYNEFDLGLPLLTRWTLSIFDLPLRMGVFWYEVAGALGLCALLVPEILFYQSRTK
jgi:hypothetical protein